MLKIKDWAVDADNTCYIVGKLKTRTNKAGEEEEVISSPKYFGTLAGSLSYILNAEKRSIVAEEDLSLGELISKLNRADEEFRELFRQATKEGKE